MKVLYVASNPTLEDSLLLEKEVTRIQRCFLRAAGEPVHFIALPDLPIEQFPTEVATHRPDILHISAHGADGHLSFANEAGDPVRLSASMLKAFLDYDKPPRLVYLNACDSLEVVKDLVSIIPMALGTTAPVENMAAREAAALFYDRILQGFAVSNAYAASCAMIETLQSKAAASVLACQPGVLPEREMLYHTPRLLAQFHEKTLKEDGSQYRFRPGIAGCPSDTVQIVFFTDDETFVEDNEYMEVGLCEVARTMPVSGEVWASSYSWESYGDMRIFGVGSTASGRTFSTGALLCDALETFYRLTASDPLKPDTPDSVVDTITKLRGMDGSEIRKAAQKRRGKRTR